MLASVSGRTISRRGTACAFSSLAMPLRGGRNGGGGGTNNRNRNRNTVNIVLYAIRSEGKI